MDALGQLVQFFNEKHYLDQAFPEIKEGEWVDNKEVLICKTDTWYKCGHCGRATKWIDAAWGIGLPVCSLECMDSCWGAYSRALGNPPTVSQNQEVAKSND